MNDDTRLQLAKQFASASNQLSFNLLAAAGGDANQNFALSGASIELALAMTAGGAQGQTSSEMRKAMALADADQPGELGRAVMAHWAAEAAASTGYTPKGEEPVPGVTLETANRLYGEASYTFESDFLAATQRDFGAPLETVDFIGAFEGARATINRWVAERTHDKIEELLPANSLDSLTRLVLVNALYFKGQWSYPFRESDTHDADFMVDGQSVKVPTMVKAEGYGHKRDKDLEIVSIPYLGGRFAMTIVMPTGTASVEGLQKGLDARRWGQLTDGLPRERVQLYLPKFKVEPETSIELTGALKSLGMVVPFDPNAADFRMMANPANPDDLLYIAKVFHQAVVEVDEKGTEAAAATAVVMAARGGAPAPPPVLRIDRPFLFSISDTATGGILFLGRVADPRG
jgi:serpin B